MDKYLIEATLGGGAQAGAILKVAHKKLKRSFAMKQILCKNEKEAEKALIEAKALESLSHEFICGYKEYFSFWSKEKNSIIVCIVMDYYWLGDLKKILESRRKEKKAIEEELITKWLAQMVSVLAYIHGKKIIHRDLKPENFFIKNENFDLVIGDFGIVAEIGDVRVITRTAIGSLIWMAPEVTERPYDERSDLWSLGCILVALTTCQTLSDDKLRSDLMAMKKDDTVIERTIALIAKSYSKDLVSVVRSLMQRNFEQRPSSANLSNVPFVKSCIENLNKSEKLPTDSGVPAVMAYLTQRASDRGAVVEAMGRLTTVRDLCLDNDDKRAVLAALKQHTASAEVSALASRICDRLSDHQMRVDDHLLSTEATQILTSAAKAHPQHFAVQAPFVSFCHKVAAIGTDHLAGLTDLVPCLLAALEAFAKAEDVGVNVCGALTFLCDCDAFFNQAVDSDVLQAVHKFLALHRTDSDCIQPALSLLITITDVDSVGAAADELNFVHLLLSIIEMHLESNKLVTTALDILESLVSEEQMARSFIECQSVEDRTILEGIATLSEVFEKYKTKEETVAKVLTVLKAALGHDDVADICDTATVTAIVSKASQQHSKHKDIKELCDELNKLLT